MKKPYLLSLCITIFLFSACQTLDKRVFAEDMYNVALELQKAGQAERAVFYYEKCLELENPPYEAYYNVTLIYIGQGRWNRAEKYLQLMESRDPQNRNLLRLRLYLQYSRYTELLEAEEEADPEILIHSAEEILGMYDRDVYTLEVLSTLYYKLEKPDLAYTYLLQIDPDHLSEESFTLIYNIIKDSENSEELRSWLYKNQHHELMSADYLYHLLELNEQASLFEENRILLERMLQAYPEEKARLLFEQASLQLSEFSLWEEGLRNLRMSFIAGYSTWTEVETLASSVNPALKNEILNILDLYKWE